MQQAWCHLAETRLIYFYDRDSTQISSHSEKPERQKHKSQMAHHLACRKIDTDDDLRTSASSQQKVHVPAAHQDDLALLHFALRP